ncbi:hypothetical protein [Blattabacterium cuenoti]|uniref:hypothetical protein n=1 Tax=Blattabacterium cuenoti TaxID=1653831 RepID=UPI00163C78B5|nr:hypothetical protein [Blattabacterium cuenoti]
MNKIEKRKFGKKFFLNVLMNGKRIFVFPIISVYLIKDLNINNNSYAELVGILVKKKL